MSEDIIEVLLLFGLNYAKSKYSTFLDRDTIVELIETKPDCLISLKSMLTKLSQRSSSLIIISKGLNLSKFFIKLVANDSCSGICHVCDYYYACVRSHLKYTHSLKIFNANLYLSVFQKSSDVFFPEINNSIFPSISEIALKLKSAKREKIYLAKIKKEVNNDLSHADTVTCGECGKTINKKSLKDHKRMHQRNKLVKCKICDVDIKVRYLPAHISNCSQVN